ncbi:transmembrane protein 273 [Amia ocellicauda]|uniref:transmembrane protein 273 n=1 Tax=Amia ocellicauda TaxID=2972642 RepID=UPI003464B3FB
MVACPRLVSAVTLLLFIESLLTKAHGDGLNTADEIEVKYAAIGAGIGAFLSVCFVAIKLYMIKKHMLDNELSESENMKRPSLRTIHIEVKD